jgi:hypothetical protein
MAKHFFKALVAFVAIIVVGLAGFVIVNYLEQNSNQVTPASQANVAK